MRTLSYNNHKVKIYDSIDEMPIVNFQKYNKCLLIDSGIGSDADDIDAHIIKIAGFIKSGNNKKALQELQNMRQAMYMVNTQISPAYLAFAALVYSVDGEKNTDLSDDGLREVLDRLKETRHSAVTGVLLWLKKKVSEELDLYFPGVFSNVKEKEAYDRIKARTLLVLDGIMSGEDRGREIREIDRLLIGMANPRPFLGKDSVEITYDRQFEDACLLISQKMNADAKAMTALQFYNALEVIKKQAEAESKAYKRHHKKR